MAIGAFFSVGRLVAAFEATGRTGENDLGHEYSNRCILHAAGRTILPPALTRDARLPRS